MMIKEDRRLWGRENSKKTELKRVEEIVHVECRELDDFIVHS